MRDLLDFIWGLFLQFNLHLFGFIIIIQYAHDIPSSNNMIDDRHRSSREEEQAIYRGKRNHSDDHSSDASM